MSRYVQRFVENDIDVSALSHLTERVHGMHAELEMRARRVCLMRLYARSLRPLEPEGGIKGCRRGVPAHRPQAIVKSRV